MMIYRMCLFLLLAGNAWADQEFSSVYRQYDDGKTKVTSPHVEISGSFLRDKIHAGAGYAMDIVTSASSDVVSYASGEIEDTRREFSGKFGFTIEDSLVMWNFVQSEEDDYNSKTYGVFTSREFNEKNTTLGLGFNFGFDNIGSSVDPTAGGKMRNQTFSTSVAQVLSKKSIIEFVYDMRLESGFLESPYRKARVLNSNGTVNPIAENHPENRNRQAFAVKYNYFIHDWQVATSTSTRLYIDSWDVKSVTLEERLTHDFSPNFSLSLNFRLYTQTKAKFYEDMYSTSNLPFVTGNKTLATYTSYLAGVRPTYIVQNKSIIDVLGNLEVFAKLEYYIQKFSDHTDVGDVGDPSDDKKLSLAAVILGFGVNTKF